MLCHAATCERAHQCSWTHFGCCDDSGSLQIVSCLNVTDLGLFDKSGYVIRDHFAGIFNVHAAKFLKTVSYRKFRAINIESFKQDIVTSLVISNSLSSTNLQELVSAYKNEL